MHHQEVNSHQRVPPLIINLGAEPIQYIISSFLWARRLKSFLVLLVMSGFPTSSSDDLGAPPRRAGTYASAQTQGSTDSTISNKSGPGRLLDKQVYGPLGRLLDALFDAIAARRHSGPYQATLRILELDYQRRHIELIKKASIGYTTVQSTQQRKRIKKLLQYTKCVVLFLA